MSEPNISRDAIRELSHKIQHVIINPPRARTGRIDFLEEDMALKQNPIPDTIIHNSPPPLIEVAGTHREMGRQIGEACRVQVQHSVANAHVLIEQIGRAHV